MAVQMCALPWLGFVPGDVRAASAVARLAAQVLHVRDCSLAMQFRPSVRSPGQATALLDQEKAINAYQNVSDYWDVKIVGDDAVVVIMIKPLPSGPMVDDIATSCAAARS